jgi:hypothetical protein
MILSCLSILQIRRISSIDYDGNILKYNQNKRESKCDRQRKDQIEC